MPARGEKTERNRMILEMWKAGVGTNDIAREFDITPARVRAVVKRALEEAGREVMAMRTELFYGELERLTSVVRQSWAIVTAPCPMCRGRGVDGREERCGACRGDGKLHQAMTRVAAMKEMRAAIDQRARMTGMYEPERFVVEQHVHDYTEDVRNIPDDELTRALRDFEAGVQAGAEAAQEGNYLAGSDAPA